MTRGHLNLLVVCAALLMATAAVAEIGYSDPEPTYPIGVRAGYTSWENVGQMHFGAQVQMGEIMENLSFTPNLEIGLGDNLTVAALNGDVTWSFSDMVSAPWGLYGGGSLGLIWVDADNASANSDLGLSALGGLTRRFDNGHDGFLELRVGLLDSPGLKVTLGYSLF
jgi:hypothetical protein